MTSDSPINEQAQSRLLSLPEAIVVRILSHLQVRDIAAAGMACRKLYASSRSDHLWSAVYDRKFGAVQRAGCPAPWESKLNLADRCSARGEVEQRWAENLFTIRTVVEPGAKFRAVTVGHAKVPAGAFQYDEVDGTFGVDAGEGVDGVRVGGGSGSAGVGEGGEEDEGTVATFIAAGDEYCGVRVYRVGEGYSPTIELATLRGHRQAVTAVAMEFPRIWSVAADHVLRVWDLSRGQLERRAAQVAADDEAEASGVSPEERDQQLKRLRMLNGRHRALDPRCVEIVTAHDAPATCLAKHRDSLFTGSLDGLVKMWGLDGDGPRAVLHAAAPTGVNAIAANDTHVVAGLDDGHVHVWSRDTLRRLRVFRPHESLVFTVRLDDQPSARGDGGRHEVLTTSVDGGVQVTDLGTGLAVDVVREAHEAPFGCVAADWDGKRIVTAGHSMFKLWNRGSLHVGPKAVTRAHTGCVVRSCTLDADGIYTAAYDKKIVVWDYAGEVIRRVTAQAKGE